MLGALDVNWEIDNEEAVPVAKFADKPAAAPVAHAPFTEAIEDFKTRNVMPRAAFNSLEAQAKRRAFTIAGLAKQELLDTAHAELTRQIESSGTSGGGPNFGEFKTFVRERLQSAGWTPENRSHVETIFRTNVMSAYASGRFNQMRSPAVVDRVPYWQIRGVPDSRSRETHKKANGRILPALHSFWSKAYPPFGYNCRCRVIARSETWMRANSATIGPVPEGLPDPGFDSGTSQLMHAPPTTYQQAPAPSPAAPTTPQPPPEVGAGRLPMPVTLPVEAPSVEVPQTPHLQEKAAAFRDALKLEDRGAQARRMLQLQAQQVFPGAIRRHFGNYSEVLDSVSTIRKANAFMVMQGHPDAGMVVARKSRIDLAKKAARLLETGAVTEKLKAGDPRLQAIDGLRTLVHEELHGHSKVSSKSYRGLGAVVEEVGNELSAQRVIGRLFPKAELEGRMDQLGIGAYAEQVNAVVDVVVKATGKTAIEARNLLVDAHYRGVLSQPGFFSGAGEAIHALVGALDLSDAERHAIYRGLLALF